MGVWWWSGCEYVVEWVRGGGMSGCVVVEQVGVWW